MPNQKNGSSRRRMLQLAGTTLTGLIWGTSLGTARPDHADQEGSPNHSSERGPPEHANALGWLRRDGNKVALAITEEEYSSVTASDIEEIPDSANRIPFRALELQVEAINENIRTGHIEIKNNSNGFSLEQTKRKDLSEYGVDQ